MGEPLARQPLLRPCGARLLLRGHNSKYPYFPPPIFPRDGPFGYSWFNNIASKNAAEFLEAVRGYGFFEYGGIWQWPAVVLLPEECKLRVGRMSVIGLRQQLENYWGQGSILGAAVEGYENMWVPTPEKELRQVQLDRTVFSHWMNSECTQWLSYFIAKNHTLGAVHAWFAAFLGVTRESLPDLAESFTNISQSQAPKSVKSMELVHRIKIRMSFDVCIEGHDEVVDGLPSLPSNTVITTNEKGMQVIHDRLNNMFPRRIWDICANTVVPATWFCGPPCPLTGHQEVGRVGVKPVSHAWVEDRSYILTEANQQMWPIPLPKGVLLEDVRGEMINLGVRYAWLDVLCLRQRSQKTPATDLAIPVSMGIIDSIPVSTDGVMDGTPVSTRGIHVSTEVVEGALLGTEDMDNITPSTGEAVESIPLSTEGVVERREQRRLEEWKVDVPTIGAVYSNLDKDSLYGGGPIVIFMSGLGRPFRDGGWDSERHWLRRAWTLQESPAVNKCLIAGLGYNNRESHGTDWPWSCKV